MTTEQFEAEKNYRITVSIVKTWLEKGIISEKDYRKINTILVHKFKPIIGGL